MPGLGQACQCHKCDQTTLPPRCVGPRVFNSIVHGRRIFSIFCYDSELILEVISCELGASLQFALFKSVLKSLRIRAESGAGSHPPYLGPERMETAPR